MNKKTVIFPYSLDNSSLCNRYLDENNESMIATLLGTATVGENISFTLRREVSNKIIVDINQIDFSTIDKLIVINSHNKELFKSFDKILEKCKQYHVNIISYTDEIIKYCTVSFLEKLNFEVTDIIDYRFISKPIIFVGGIKDTTENAWISYMLAKQLQNKSIKVATISEYTYCDEFNMFPFPQKFMNEAINPAYRILLLNQYIGTIFNKGFDLLIIELPGGALRYDSYTYNFFGLYYYMISQAVSGDVYICSVPISQYDEKYFLKLNEYISKKFDLSIDAIHLMNIKFEDQFNKTLGNDDDYYYVSKETLDSCLQVNCNIRKIPFGTLYDQEYLERIVENIVSKLGG